MPRAASEKPQKKRDLLAGPFGGAAAFTQSSGARKRALEFRRKMKRSVSFQA